MVYPSAPPEEGAFVLAKKHGPTVHRHSETLIAIAYLTGPPYHVEASPAIAEQGPVLEPLPQIAYPGQVIAPPTTQPGVVIAPPSRPPRETAQPATTQPAEVVKPPTTQPVEVQPAGPPGEIITPPGPPGVVIAPPPPPGLAMRPPTSQPEKRTSPGTAQRKD